MSILQVLDLEPDVGIEAPEVLVPEQILYVSWIGPVPDHLGRRIGRTNEA